MKRILTTLAVAALLAAAVVGVSVAASAQEVPDDTTVPATTLDGVLDGLVTEGVITSEQAEAVKEALETAKAERGLRGPGRGGAAIGTLADVLDMEPADLMDALRSGETVAAIAAENGVSLEAVTSELVEAANDRIDSAVESGRVDAERAADLKAQVAENVDAFVNGELNIGRGFGSRGFGPRGFGPGGFGPDAELDADSATDAFLSA